MNAKRYDVKMTETTSGKYVPYRDYAILQQMYDTLVENKNPSIFTVTKNLDISTVHISEQDNQLLSNNNNYRGLLGALILHPYGEGYFIYVEQSETLFQKAVDKVIKEHYSHAFIEILKLAHDLGCSFIQLDGAGTEYKHLTKFDW
jgi:hypothetical protein